MSKVVKTLFGGPDKSSLNTQIGFNNQATDFIKSQAAQARGDAYGLAPAGQDNRNMGYQAALDVLGMTIPQQFSTFQQGNVGAQGALLAGLPQVQNAILGLPTDLSGLQPQAINYDASFAQQQLPNFTNIRDINTPSNPGTVPAGMGGMGGKRGLQNFDYSRLLAGTGGYT